MPRRSLFRLAGPAITCSLAVTGVEHVFGPLPAQARFRFLLALLVVVGGGLLGTLLMRGPGLLRRVPGSSGPRSSQGEGEPIQHNPQLDRQVRMYLQRTSRIVEGTSSKTML